MTTEQVRRFAGSDALAASVAEDVVSRLRAVQAEGRVPSLVLTGGTIARDIHAAIAVAPDPPDWTRVDFWWGDERFLATGHPDRNATQAWEDLLGRVPVDSGRVHEIPASDTEPGGRGDPAAAAAAYAHDLRRFTDDRFLDNRGATDRGAGECWFDVLMLGIGPDGHCASLFPGRREVRSTEDVLPVLDSPKPPPTRVTLTLPVLRRGRHVMFVATGAEKAEAVAASVRGADVVAAPAAGPRGVDTTTWYVDDEAATDL